VKLLSLVIVTYCYCYVAERNKLSWPKCLEENKKRKEGERERLLLERWVGGFSLSFTCIGWVLEHTMFFYLRLFIVIVPLAKIIMIISVSM